VGQHFFDSGFLGNGYHSPSGFFKNNITKALVVHLDAFWQIIDRPISHNR
jgi:hypothetical protein